MRLFSPLTEFPRINGENSKTGSSSFAIFPGNFQGFFGKFMEKEQKNSEERKSLTYRDVATRAHFGYFAFPIDLFKLLENKILTNKEFLIFTVLHQEAFLKNSPAVTIGLGSIATKIGSSRHRVKECLKQLKNKAIISYENGSKGSTKALTYTIDMNALEGLISPKNDPVPATGTDKGKKPEEKPQTVTATGTDCTRHGYSTVSATGTLINNKVFKDISISDTRRKNVVSAFEKLRAEFEEEEILAFVKSKDAEYFKGIKFGYEKYLRNGLRMFQSEYQELKTQNQLTNKKREETKRQLIATYGAMGWTQEQINNQLQNMGY